MKKRLLSLLLMGLLTFSLVACGSSEKNTSSSSVTNNENSEDEIVTYNIAVCTEEDKLYSQYLTQGFVDCIVDYYGNTASISIITESGSRSCDAVAAIAKAGNYDLIYTVGEHMLTSCRAIIEDIPIVAAGVVDFQSTLRIADNGKSWNKTTGFNVTGITSRPSIVDQVSLLIESTADLQTVGLLFSPEDADAIYQNEIFEKYLNQAGIPWKEYSIPATTSAIVEDEDDSTTAISPIKQVIVSAKVGVDYSVDALGENLLTGIISPSSTRIALQSDLWTTGKLLPDLDEVLDGDNEGNEEETDSSTKSSTVSDEEEPAPPTLEELITVACNECSALYIPYDSMLSDQMSEINAIAVEAGVVTVGGDLELAENALVTLFYDPYSLGYSAGKKARKVLNGSDITTMKISSGDSDNIVKIYNGDVAEAMGITFPKSFKELHSFLETYEFGSTTTRYVAPVEE